jgi:hypothetical protein
MECLSDGHARRARLQEFSSPHARDDCAKFGARALTRIHRIRVAALSEVSVDDRCLRGWWRARARTRHTSRWWWVAPRMRWTSIAAVQRELTHAVPEHAHRPIGREPARAPDDDWVVRGAVFAFGTRCRIEEAAHAEPVALYELARMQCREWPRTSRRRWPPCRRILRQRLGNDQAGRTETDCDDERCFESTFSHIASSLTSALWPCLRFERNRCS